jgi:phosphoesterase RecJ-like protein
MSEYLSQFNAAALALQKAKNVVTVSHRRPDGDTIGSALALAGAFSVRGEEIKCFCADPPPPNFSGLPEFSRFTTDPSVLAAADFLIILDAGDMRFAGVAPVLEKMAKRPVIVDIDHHVVNERYGDVNLIVPTAASTTEVVFRLLKVLNWKITAEMSTALLLGIATDTMMFFNPATTASALQAAAELERLGADVKKVGCLVTRCRDINSLILWGKALERLKWDEKRSRASTAIMADELAGHRCADDAIDGLSNFLNNNLSARTVMVLRELEKGMIKGSLRTADADNDVSAEALAMGGGGHRKAAGFVVRGKIVEKENEWTVQVE